MKQFQYWVYILANPSNTVLYIGMTDNLQRRIKEHREKLHPNSFTARYNCTKCVYFEIGNDAFGAIEREKQIKHWARKKKDLLVEKINPTWKELVL